MSSSVEAQGQQQHDEESDVPPMFPADSMDAVDDELLDEPVRAQLVVVDRSVNQLTGVRVQSQSSSSTAPKEKSSDEAPLAPELNLQVCHCDVLRFDSIRFD